MASPLLRIGTRGSPLALAQSRELQARLAAAHPALAAEDAIAILPIRTSGDRLAAVLLADAGGKGLFTKEIEEALLAGTIDVAVHSLKDMPTPLPPGLVIACHLPREDPRDALIAAPGVRGLADLPRGAKVGTSSPRRKAQLLNARPDLEIIPFRGNVGTRLAKLADGAVHATLLALAGLRRLRREDCISALLEPAEILPAAGQGVIVAQTREGDEISAAWLAPIEDMPTRICVHAERALLAALGGDCRTPIAGLATLAGERLALDAMVIRPDGTEFHRVRRDGPASAAAAMGYDAGAELKARAGPDFFAP
jgi:hydroxymethylbilane synthase